MESYCVLFRYDAIYEQIVFGMRFRLILCLYCMLRFIHNIENIDTYLFIYSLYIHIYGTYSTVYVFSSFLC